MQQPEDVPSSPGTFVELGALDGVTGSNTILLERCFGWNGLLIEANPGNYDRLIRGSQRAATKTHAAVCDSKTGTVRITMQPGPVAGQVDVAGASRARNRTGYHIDRVVSVPCRPLPTLMREAMVPRDLGIAPSN